MTTDLEKRLRERLTTATRERDRPLAAALRTCLGALDNATAVPVERQAAVTSSGPVAGAVTGLGAGEAARREVTAEEQRALVEAEIEDLRAHATMYAAAGRAEESQRQLRVVAVLLDVVR